MAFLFLDKRNIIIGAIILSIVFALGVIIGKSFIFNFPLEGVRVWL